MKYRLNRRTFLGGMSLASAGWGMAAPGTAMDAADPSTEGTSSLAIDPSPRFELSPYLYMQFMEPLGTTDGSVAAAWDHLHNRWREGFIEVSRDRGRSGLRGLGRNARRHRPQAEGLSGGGIVELPSRHSNLMFRTASL
jgi:hypothetical protein